MSNTIYEIGDILQEASALPGFEAAVKPAQRLFLERLAHAVAVLSEYGPLLDESDPALGLLKKTIYSNYCDCVDLGVRAQAKAILAGGRGEVAASTGK